MGNVSKALARNVLEKAVKPAQPPVVPMIQISEPQPEDTRDDKPVSAVQVVMEKAPPRIVEAPEPTIAIAPEVTDHYAPCLVTYHNHAEESMIVEQYRALRSRLLATYSQGSFCLMITSSQVGEGKTITALNLAFALAGKKECKTLVVDCDLRKRRVAPLLHLEDSPGLAEVIQGKASIAQAIRATAFPNVFVLPAGSPRPDEVGELVGRPELQEIVGRLRRQYDFILLDTAPATVTSDVSMLGMVATDALMVVQMNKTRQESVTRALHLLDAVNVKVIGLVLTHQRYYIPTYVYRYS